ncbi:hypothetical protein NL676_025311 [Syzygium grande]|nr:hypothetical protein NL676_025311 [Syzygium grande]
MARETEGSGSTTELTCEGLSSASKLMMARDREACVNSPLHFRDYEHDDPSNGNLRPSRYATATPGCDSTRRRKSPSRTATASSCAPVCSARGGAMLGGEAHRRGPRAAHGFSRARRGGAHGRGEADDDDCRRSEPAQGTMNPPRATAAEPPLRQINLRAQKFSYSVFDLQSAWR